MPNYEPIETTNLDIYGSDALPWSRARAGLESGIGEASVGSGDPANRTFFLSTVGTNDKPHTAGVGAVWIDDQSGSRRAKGRARAVT